MSTRGTRVTTVDDADEEYLRTGYSRPNSFEKDPEVSERYKRNSRNIKERFIDSIHKNPCYQERQMTLKCLERTGEPSQCRDYSQNVKRCKAFWNRVIKDRKKKGIEPHLPAVEDRPQVLKDHANWLY